MYFFDPTFWKGFLEKLIPMTDSGTMAFVLVSVYAVPGESLNFTANNEQFAHTNTISDANCCWRYNKKDLVRVYTSPDKMVKEFILGYTKNTAYAPVADDDAIAIASRPFCSLQIQNSTPPTATYASSEVELLQLQTFNLTNWHHKPNQVYFYCIANEKYDIDMFSNQKGVYNTLIQKIEKICCNLSIEGIIMDMCNAFNAISNPEAWTQFQNMLYHNIKTFYAHCRNTILGSMRKDLMMVSIPSSQDSGSLRRIYVLINRHNSSTAKHPNIIDINQLSSLTGIKGIRSVEDTVTKIEKIHHAQVAFTHTKLICDVVSNIRNIMSNIVKASSIDAQNYDLSFTQLEAMYNTPGSDVQREVSHVMKQMSDECKNYMKENKLVEFASMSMKATKVAMQQADWEIVKEHVGH